MGKKGVTTIQVYPETREILKHLGIKGESYDEIIQRLVRIYRENNSS